MVLHPFRTSFLILCSLHNSALHEQKQIFHIFEYARGWCNGNSRQFRQFYVSVQLKQWSYKTRFVKGKNSIAMKKIVIIGDSNQAFLLPLKIALLLGCPVFSGHEDKSNRAYCSSSDWPEVKKIHHFWKEIQNILAESLSMGQYGDQSSQSFGKTPRRWGHSFDSTIQHERYHKFGGWLRTDL